MPSPTDWHNHKVDKPQNDEEYFERMSRVIFMSGLNWRTLEKKWPGIKKAFADFDISAVADFDERKIDELTSNPDVIRNQSKIRAVVANADEFAQIQSQFGSFGKYLSSLRSQGGEDLMRATISQRFAFMGNATTAIFLFSVGEDLPKARLEWQDRHR